MKQSPSWEASRFAGSQEIPAFYGTRRFITAFTSTRHLSLSWASSIQSMLSHPTYLANSLATAVSGPDLYRLQTFHAPNLMPLFHSLGRTKVSVRVRDKCSCFVTKPVFTVRSCHHIGQPSSWTTTLFRLSAIVYSIYSELPSILEAVPPSASWGRAMS